MDNSNTFPWIENYDSGVPRDFVSRPAPVYTMLDDTVRLYGHRPAFDFLGKRYDWAQIGALADRLAAGLQKKAGVVKGTRVGLFLPNTPYFLIAYYAVLKAGGTIVNFNPLYAEHEVVHQIADSGTQIMITADLELLHAKLDKVFPQTALKHVVYCRFADILPFPKNILFPLFKPKETARIKDAAHVLWFHDLVQNDGRFAPTDIDPANDIAVLQYTGGTTGTPKGAMLTHANIHANAVQSLSWVPGVRRGEQRMLGVLPFFHVFAMTAIMNFGVLAGFEITVLPRFDLKETLKAIHRKKPHFFPAVPAIYSAINNCTFLKRYDLSSIKYCVSGGAPLPVEVKRRFEEITGCVVVEGYGLTEASPVVCCNPVGGENVAGSIGMPIPGTVVEIVDPDDKVTLRNTGDRGELCVRGPQVMKGYWNRPEETAQVLRGGRLHTGDIAVLDDRGYVYIVDRLKDMIITNGYNVYPRNVEEAIYKHPAVEECIVAGLPDDQRGEVVKAWVKLKAGQSLDAGVLKEFLEDKLSRMEIPRQIEFRDTPLPKTMIGKLSRKDVVAEEGAKMVKK